MTEILKNRRIDTLTHFTRVENLSNILSYGLYPRKKLQQGHFTFLYNDDYRYDGCENAVCTSIEFPNYKMFYSLRKNNPGTDWAVLILNASVLVNLKCAFCRTNAASEEMYQQALDEQKGTTAFLKLFEELHGGPSREYMSIPDWYPTNPQAEVLVFDIIPVEYIKCVAFNNRETLDKYKDDIPPGIKAKIDNDLFYGRCDYKFWQKTE